MAWRPMASMPAGASTTIATGSASTRWAVRASTSPTIPSGTSCAAISPRGGTGPNQVYDHPDKPHAITLGAGGQTFQYDDDGNAIARGSQTLGYDSENRLICAGPIGSCGAVTFGYDLDGVRLYQQAAGETRVLFGELFEWNATDTEAAAHVYAFGERIATKVMTSPTLRAARSPQPFG